RSTFIAVEKIRYLVFQLNPIAQAVVDVEKGSLNFTFSRTAEVRRGDVDFPVSIARGARVVGEQWGGALSKNLCRAAKKQRRDPRDFTCHSVSDARGRAARQERLSHWPTWAQPSARAAEFSQG